MAWVTRQEQACSAAWHVGMRNSPSCVSALSREAVFDSCIQSMRCDRMVSRTWPWYTIIWAMLQTLLMLTTSPLRVAAVEWWRLTALDGPSVCSRWLSWVTSRSHKPVYILKLNFRAFKDWIQLQWRKLCLVTSNFINPSHVTHYCSYSSGGNWKEITLCLWWLLSSWCVRFQWP